MAITSYGYPTSLGADADIWARFATHAFGRRYAAPVHGQFRVTAATSGTRQVNISEGWLVGKGVLVHNTADTTLNLPAPSGSSQWFAIVLRRWVDDPDPEGSFLTELVYIAGTATREVPDLAAQVTDGIDEQPIALVRVSSTETLVQQVLDLRPISFEAGGFYVVHSPEAMELLEGMIGVEVYRTDSVGKGFYKRLLDASGAASWRNMQQSDQTFTNTAATDGPTAGWNRENGARLVVNGAQRWQHIVVTRLGNIPGGSVITSDEHGGVGDIIVAKILPGHEPPSGVTPPMFGRIRGTDGSTYFASGHATAGGDILLNSLPPNVSIGVGAELILTGNWYR